MRIQDKLKPLQEEYNKYLHLYNEAFLKIEEILKEDMDKFDSFLLDLNISILPDVFIYEGKEITREEVLIMFQTYKNK